MIASWESLAIAGAQLAFFVPLVNNLRKKATRIPKESSAVTAIGLWVISVSFFGLGEYLDALTAGLSAFGWLGLLLWRRA